MTPRNTLIKIFYFKLCNKLKRNTLCYIPANPSLNSPKPFTIKETNYESDFTN